MNERPLRPIRAGADGVGIGVEFVNDIIQRIEDLVIVAQQQKPLAGENIVIQYTPNGAIINAVTQ
jgi:hypothetical protein